MISLAESIKVSKHFDESLLSKKPSTNAELGSDAIKDFIWGSKAPHYRFEIRKNELHIMHESQNAGYFLIAKDNVEKIKSLGMDIFKTTGSKLWYPRSQIPGF